MFILYQNIFFIENARSHNIEEAPPLRRITLVSRRADVGVFQPKMYQMNKEYFHKWRNRLCPSCTLCSRNNVFIGVFQPLLRTQWQKLSLTTLVPWMNKHWNVECCFGQFLLSASEGNLAHREIISESGYIKPNLDCNCIFLIYLEPNRIFVYIIPQPFFQDI